MTDGWLKLVFVKEILVSSNLNEKLISELHGEVKPIETSYGSDHAERMDPTQLIQAQCERKNLLTRKFLCRFQSQ
jgi:hypothetical protein